MSMELTARTPLPYRLVRPWVSTIVVLLFSMTVKLRFARRGVVSRKSDFRPHPDGRRIGSMCDFATCDLSSRWSPTMYAMTSEVWDRGVTYTAPAGGRPHRTVACT